LLVLYFHWTRKVSTDVSPYHDHNHNFQMGYRNLKDMNDNFGLPQKRSHNLFENISKIIIGNGTTSREITKKMDFFKKEIIIFEEKNTTFRAKSRYFELFPISGLKFLIPREILILNKNLDAISALIILEDYCKMKFTLEQNVDSKTWLK